MNELAREALTYGRIHELQSFGVYESLNGWPILGPERISFDATANRPRRIVVDTASGVFATDPQLIGYHEDRLERILPFLEGVPVDTVAGSLDAELRVALPLEEALRRTDVDPTRYAWVRSRLRRAGMGSMAARATWCSGSSPGVMLHADWPIFPTAFPSPTDERRRAASPSDTRKVSSGASRPIGISAPSITVGEPPGPYPVPHDPAPIT